MASENPVQYATVRDGGDEWHIECRFKDGQKFAAVTVDRDHEDLADYIAAALSDRAAVAELVEALQEADAAIKEWFRYLHGGEMRGSYDGKPEREMLRKAGYRTSAALSRHQAGLGKGVDRG